MDTIIYERFLHVVKNVFLAKSHPEIVILGDTCGVSVSSHLVETFFADKYCVVGYRTDERKNFFDVLVFFWEIIFLEKNLSSAIDEDKIRSDDICFWVVFEVRNLRREPFWESDVITVKIGNISSSCKFQSLISCKANPFVCLVVHYTDSFIKCYITVNHHSALIFRSIIDDNELKIRVGLGDNTFDTFIQISGGIIHGKYDRYDGITFFLVHG